MKTESKLVSDYLSRGYSELQGMIRLADTKANIIIALIGVVLSLFFNFFVSKNILPFWQVMLVLALFFVSGFYALATLYPRLPPKSKKSSALYYMGGMEFTLKSATKFMSEDCEKEIIEDYIINIQNVSKIIDIKFRKLRLSYLFFGLAIVVKIIFETYVWFSL